MQIWKNVISASYSEGEDVIENIDDIYFEEALDILKSIQGFLETEYGEMHHWLGECLFALALVFMRGNNVIARDYLNRVNGILLFCLGLCDILQCSGRV